MIKGRLERHERDGHFRKWACLYRERVEYEERKVRKGKAIRGVLLCNFCFDLLRRNRAEKRKDKSDE